MKRKIKYQKLTDSVFFRLFVVLMAILLPVNILIIVYSMYTYDNVRKEIYIENKSVMEQYMYQFDTTLEQVSNVTYRMSSEKDSLILRQGNVETVSNSVEWYRARTAMTNEFKKWGQDYPIIEGFFAYYIYGDGSDSIAIASNRSINEKGNSVTNLFLEATKGRVKEAVQQENGYIGIAWEPVQLDGNTYLWTLRKSGNCYYGAWLDLDDLLLKWQTNENANIMYGFLDIQGKQCGEYTISLMSSMEEKEYQIKVDSTKSDISLIAIEKRPILDGMPIAATVLIVLSIFSLLVIPVVIHVIRKQVLRPVNNLIGGMAIVESGDLKYQLEEERGRGEFAKLTKSFNGMLTEIHDLKIETYEKELEKQKIRMKLLSQQIQPHFILNTLSILNSYEPEEYNLIQRMIICLAKYFRYVVNAQTQFVELNEELDHIRNYFEIQQARYPDKFYWYVEAEEGLEQLLIPPLLIQNFTENAIKYSVSMKSKVSIYVLVQRQSEDLIRIRIADTGKGLPLDVLQAIEEFKKTHQPQKNLGIGIQNAIERLDILYQGVPTISFYNSEDGGATIDIIMPFVIEQMLKEQDDEDRNCS